MYRKIVKNVIMGLLLLIGIPLFSQAGTGDVNGSGSVDIVDGLLIAQYYVGLNPSPFIQASADVNCDTAIDIVDALMVARYYVGLLTGFPECNQETPAPTPGPTATPGGQAGKTVSTTAELADAVSAAAAGDVITINGTISSGRLNLSNSGTANVRIVYRKSTGFPVFPIIWFTYFLLV